MVDLAEIRQKLEAEADGESEKSEDTSLLAGFIAPIPGWKKELNDFSISAPLSIGSGILMALMFDYIRSKGDAENQVFEGTWKTLAMVSGSFLFGWGAGKLSRGVVAQAEGEYHQKLIQEAEAKVQEAEEAKEAEEQKASNVAYNILTDPTAFQLAPSRQSLNIFGEYGNAIGQSQLSYQFMG